MASDHLLLDCPPLLCDHAQRHLSERSRLLLSLDGNAHPDGDDDRRDMDSDKEFQKGIEIKIQERWSNVVVE